MLDAESRLVVRASANLADYPGLALSDAVGRIADDILPNGLVGFLKAQGETADVGYKPVPLLPAQAPNGAAVDLTWCSSRSISPVHQEYMANMGVQSSLSLPIMLDGELWCMILAHHPRPHRISPLMRSYLQMVAQVGADALRVALQREVEADVDTIMGQVSAVLNELNVDQRGLLNAVQQHHELLDAFEAETAIIRLHSQEVLLGKPCPADTLELVEAQVADEALEGPVSSDDIGARIPAFQDDARRGWLGGFLYARLRRRGAFPAGRTRAQ